MYKLGRLDEVSFGMLNLGELGEMSFRKLKFGGLGDVSFGKYKLGILNTTVVETKIWIFLPLKSAYFCSLYGQEM